MNTLKNKNFSHSYLVVLLLSTIMHIFVLTFFKKHSGLGLSKMAMAPNQFFKKIRIEKIQTISPDKVDQLRKVGISGGSKNSKNPLINESNNSMTKASKNLSFKNLGVFENQLKDINSNSPARSSPSMEQKNLQFKEEDLNLAKSNTGDIYFNYKKQKVIPQSREHNAIKNETIKSLGVDRIHSKANNISNFDIRIERPEGISEDQLNSDEKAFYSFYKRTYLNYVSKLYSTYENFRIGHPAIDQDLDEKHLLIGKIDYDENGNIVTIKILKSSESDTVHMFFEEVLKNLTIPNPPKIFIKKQKQFSIYYQIHIN